MYRVNNLKLQPNPRKHILEENNIYKSLLQKSLKLIKSHCSIKKRGTADIPSPVIHRFSNSMRENTAIKPAGKTLRNSGSIIFRFTYL